MDSPTYEVDNKEQLLEYLQEHGITVLVWNEAGAVECRHCRMAEREMRKTAHARDREHVLRERIAERLVFMGFRQGQVGFNNIVEAIAVIARLRQGEQIMLFVVYIFHLATSFIAGPKSALTQVPGGRNPLLRGAFARQSWIPHLPERPNPPGARSEKQPPERRCRP